MWKASQRPCRTARRSVTGCSRSCREYSRSQSAGSGARSIRILSEASNGLVRSRVAGSSRGTNSRRSREYCVKPSRSGRHRLLRFGSPRCRGFGSVRCSGCVGPMSISNRAGSSPPDQDRLTSARSACSGAQPGERSPPHQHVDIHVRALRSGDVPHGQASFLGDRCRGGSRGRAPARSAQNTHHGGGRVRRECLRHTGDCLGTRRHRWLRGTFRRPASRSEKRARKAGRAVAAMMDAAVGGNETTSPGD